MKILFLSLSSAISNINNRGIYPDLLRYFAGQEHDVYIMCPYERKSGKNTELISYNNVHILGVKTLNLTKSRLIEKGIGTLMLEYQFFKAWQKYFFNIPFDLILYSTPPITFNKLILSIKKITRAKSYLLLKDIFPQNAVDLGIISKLNPFYHFFKYKEKQLYRISDFIGCMSEANVKYICQHNPDIDPRKVEICPNSIELRSEKYHDRKNTRKKLNIPEHATVFIYGGNLGKPQGIDFLIDILNTNLEKNDRFFIIAGSGTEAHKIENFIALNLNSNVLFLGSLKKDEFDEVVDASDVGLIFLDHKYTIPNYPSRLLTYLEYKLPVLMATDIVTDIGSDAEKNGYGIWVESNNVKAFNDKVDILIKNRDDIIIKGQKGFEYLKSHFTVKNSYDTILNHFRSESGV